MRCRTKLKYVYVSPSGKQDITFPQFWGTVYGMGVISEVPALGNLKGCVLLSLCLVFSFDCPTAQSVKQQTSCTSFVSNWHKAQRSQFICDLGVLGIGHSFNLAMIGLDPPYTAELLRPYSTSRPLRSSDLDLLSIPHSLLKSKGDCAFAVRVRVRPGGPLYLTTVVKSCHFCFNSVSLMS